MKTTRSNQSQALNSSNGLEALYTRALPAKRNGHLYGAFPYPTKISPEAIALFIAAHTKPGDTVFDGFAGSGTTGLAALLCGTPTEMMCAEAERLGLDLKWGARNAVLYEIGVLGAFISQILTNPPEPRTFRKAAEEILHAAQAEDGWMYSATDPDGKNGSIRYVIWSDVLECPMCSQEATLWDSCVSFDPTQIAGCFSCPTCGHKASLRDVQRRMRETRDDMLDNNRYVRARRLARVHGSTGKKNWSRNVMSSDLALLKRIKSEPIPASVPCVAIPWGDLHRRGYHQGITHIHHMYTKRNLIVFGRLWARAGCYKGALGDALRFWLLSYNASHATIMTRVVAKSGQKDLVLTGAQSGVLYVSGLPVEKNLFAGLRRKLATITNAFAITHGHQGRIEVVQASSCNTHLPDCSIDYVFTDPPFGGNIPYAELSFINEAWLGRYTDRAEETIVSNAQDKALPDYQQLLTTALIDVRRILRPGGKATLVFHSASAGVWNTLQAAYTNAGFSVESAGVLDKRQGSFKQVTAKGAVRGDPVLLLSQKKPQQTKPNSRVWRVAEQLRLEAARIPDPDRPTAQYLYPRLVNHFLTRNQEVPLDADSFYRWYEERDASEVQEGERL